jgi:hypothetical protein
LNEATLTALLSTILTRLAAVWVTLDEADNAHRVFQTLNAGGKKLRQSDLVRNYFFLLLSETSDAFYSEHWRQMENDLSERELEDYLVAWSISQGHSGSRESLFNYFHKDLLPIEASLDAVSQYGSDLTATARQFRWIRRPSDSPFDSSVRQTMQDLANWSTVPAEGLILWLLRSHGSGALTAAELRSSQEIILSFMARRQMAGLEPNLHKSIFVGVTRQIRAAKLTSGADVVGLLHYLLSSGSDLRTWPSDDAIKANARSTSIYSAARSGWAFSLLERINRGMFESAKHAPSTLDRSKYSVEHIMPQSLTKEWIDDLTSWGVTGPVQLHQSHLHTLGNLTISPINSELGNASFTTKRAKLADDWLKLNQEVVSSSTWTEHRMDERSTALAGIACTVYVSPLTGDALQAAQSQFRPVASGSEEDSADEAAQDLEDD